MTANSFRHVDNVIKRTDNNRKLKKNTCKTSNKSKLGKSNLSIMFNETKKY